MGSRKLCHSIVVFYVVFHLNIIEWIIAATYAYAEKNCQ